MEQQSYFLIIPAPIFNDEELSDKEKLLTGLINSLLNDEGYCYASNEYLAKKMNTTTQNISRLLGNLNKKGHIEFQYIRNGTVVKNRKIFPTLPLTKMLIAINKNDNGTVNKNVKERKKDISNKTNIYIKKENIKRKKYGKFKRILLTDEEYKRLNEEFKDNFIDKQIKYLDEYIQSNNNKNKYKDFNLVIRKAIRENWFKKNIIEDLTKENEGQAVEEMFDYNWLEESEDFKEEK